jgi:hypothetical protein
MKKITYLFTLLISFWGFSQNLVTNGNFQTGTAAPWTGNAANVVDLGASNWVNQANVTVAANPWDVNLSQVVNLTSGKTYKLKFDAFTAAATGTRTLISGLGQTAAPFASLTSTSVLTSTPQTFSFDITINYGEAVTDRVIFDMGNATGFVFIDNVSVVEVMPLIQNFETPVTYTSVASFGGSVASVATDPASGAANGQVLKGVQGPGGEVWQGIEFTQTAKKAKLTTNKTMTADVYCSQAFNVLAKVEQGGTGPNSANGQAYTTPGQWQTLTFNFAVPMDGTVVANGEYQKIVFFGNWKATNDGFNAPLVPLTFYIDNIRAEETIIPVVLPLIQNFEAPVTYTLATGFEGAVASLATDPATGGANGQVFKGVQGPGGQPWQGIEFVQTTKSAKLTTNKTMTVAVYCSQAFNILAKVSDGGTAPASANGQAYTTPGQWQTLTFNFAVPMDNTAVANGEYKKISFFGNWKSTNDGFNTPLVPLTFYLDNVRAEEGIIIPASDPIPLTPAPVPTALNANVYSIYNDTNNYTTIFPVAYSFGTLSGEPDLDSSATVNKAYKFNFGVAGWGQGEAMANVTSYNFVSFDYWAQPGLPNGFKFVMISNSGGVVEKFYQIGTNEALVTGQWKKVEIPMSYFTNLGFASTNFFQWKVSPFADSVTNAGFVYIDNILLTTNSLLNNNSFNINTVSLYPNPTTNVLNIESEGTIQNIAIFNVLGQEVVNKSTNESSIRLDVSGLNAGVYLVKTIIDGKVSSTKFIKE